MIFKVVASKSVDQFLSLLQDRCRYECIDNLVLPDCFKNVRTLLKRVLGTDGDVRFYKSVKLDMIFSFDGIHLELSWPDVKSSVVDTKDPGLSFTATEKVYLVSNWCAVIKFFIRRLFSKKAATSILSSTGIVVDKDLISFVIARFEPSGGWGPISLNFLDVDRLIRTYQANGMDIVTLISPN